METADRLFLGSIRFVKLVTNFWINDHSELMLDVDLSNKDVVILSKLAPMATPSTYSAAYEANGCSSRNVNANPRA